MARLHSLKLDERRIKMVSKTNRKLERTRRHIRVRTKISGTPERPRLCVYRSNTNIYAQIIDDVAGKTLVAVSTLDKDVKTKYSNKEAAKEVGTLIAKKAIEKNIKTVVFDRGGYIYHGIIKELAEAAREGGLEF
jgi:large subunit ribosomal protein L18